MNNDIAIKVDSVYKEFRLPHEKVGSVKNIFTNLIGYIRKRRSYETQHALRDISFEVKKGEFFGVVGRNGSGKSTLLKLLAEIYQPTKGSVAVDGRLIPFIELGVGFNAELTGRENVYLNGALIGFSKDEIDGMYDEIVEFAEIENFMDQKLKNYSSGMQVRLAFSLAIRAEADILLVDEVLAVGDADFQRKCFKYFKELKANKKTVVFVTHDMNAVREYCDRAILIDKSHTKLIGTPQTIAREYSLLFMENDPSNKNDPMERETGKRWGNGTARIVDIKVSVQEKSINFDVIVKVQKSSDKIIYGLHIVGQDGVELTAMNNRMILAPDMVNLKPGDNISFKWEMLNIFNDGNYSVTLTLVDDLSNVLDWQTEAAKFSVKRTERSTTSIMPPVSVVAKVIKERK